MHKRKKSGASLCDVLEAIAANELRAQKRQADNLKRIRKLEERLDRVLELLLKHVAPRTPDRIRVAFGPTEKE